MEEKSIRFEDIPNAITGVLNKLSSFLFSSLFWREIFIR